MIAGIFLNSVVVISMWKSTQLRKKLCYFTIFLLSCFNLAAVAIIHPLVIWLSIEKFLKAYEHIHYAIAVFIIIVLQNYSMIALLILNLECLLALNYPFFHQTTMTKKRVLLFLISICYFNTILKVLTFQKLVISHHVMAITRMPIFFIIFLIVVNIQNTECRCYKGSQ